MLSVLLYKILSIQIVYSVQLNEIGVITGRHSDCNFECVTVQYIVCTNKSQCAAELNLV